MGVHHVEEDRTTQQAEGHDLAQCNCNVKFHIPPISTTTRINTKAGRPKAML